MEIHKLPSGLQGKVEKTDTKVRFFKRKEECRNGEDSQREIHERVPERGCCSRRHALRGGVRGSMISVS